MSLKRSREGYRERKGIGGRKGKGKCYNHTTLSKRKAATLHVLIEKYCYGVQLIKENKVLNHVYVQLPLYAFMYMWNGIGWFQLLFIKEYS